MNKLAIIGLYVTAEGFNSVSISNAPLFYILSRHLNYSVE